MWKMLAIAGLLLLPATGAGAQLIGDPPTCHFEWDMNGILQHQSEFYHKQYSGGAVRVCVDSKGKLLDGELFDAPEKNRLGLCSVRSWIVPLKRNGGSVEPRSEPIYGNEGVTVRMLETDHACPRQDDPDYVTAGTVPDGVFLHLLHMWNAISRSPDDVRALSATGVKPSWQDDLIEALKDETRHIRLAGIRADAQVHVKGDPNGGWSTRYEITVHEGDELTSWYDIGVDWVDGQFRIVSISHWEV